ncbi:MAG: hypothetical protein QOF33_4447, partial [Thermomicrobiales bacterium]|nr:hypothetical protein [Thermomicrobiales bacterium]
MHPVKQPVPPFFFGTNLKMHQTP